MHSHLEGFAQTHGMGQQCAPILSGLDQLLPHKSNPLDLMGLQYLRKRGVEEYIIIPHILPDVDADHTSVLDTPVPGLLVFRTTNYISYRFVKCFSLGFCRGILYHFFTRSLPVSNLARVIIGLTLRIVSPTKIDC